MAPPNERFHDASRVQTETGDWVAARAMVTMHFRSGRELRVIRSEDGTNDELQPPIRVCSRAAEATR